MTKQLINAPVGAKPYKETRYGSSYIAYDSHEIIYPTGSLNSLLNELVCLKKKYSDRYQDLTIEEKNDCGCFHDCSCSPSYIVYGKRFETQLEYDIRIANETQRVEEQRKQDEQTLVDLAKKLGKTCC